MGDKKRDGDTTNLHSLYTCSKSMSLDIPKSVSRWSTWRQGKKPTRTLADLQNSFWPEICLSMQHMPAGCARKWILWCITERHLLRIISWVHTLLWASEKGSKIKHKSISGYFWREKLAGIAAAPDLILPQLSIYPWKWLCFRNCRAGELCRSSCKLSKHLTSRILLLPLGLNFSDSITQLLAHVAFLIAKLKILI